MPDTTAAPGMGDGAGTQTEPTATGQVPSGVETPTPADLQAELERTRKALKDANAESAQHRKKLQAFEAAEAQRKTAAMTELEQAQAKVAELEKRATEAEAGKRQALIRAAVIARAQSKGFREPEDVLRFLDTSGVEITADGQVKDVDTLLTDLGTKKPYLLQPTGTVGATNPGRGQAAGETDDQRRQRLFGGGASALGTQQTGGYVPLRE